MIYKTYQRIRSKFLDLPDEAILFAALAAMALIVILLKGISMALGISFLPIIIAYLAILLVGAVYFAVLAFKHAKRES